MPSFAAGNQGQAALHLLKCILAICCLCKAVQTVTVTRRPPHTSEHLQINIMNLPSPRQMHSQCCMSSTQQMTDQHSRHWRLKGMQLRHITCKATLSACAYIAAYFAVNLKAISYSSSASMLVQAQRTTWTVLL